MFKTDINNTREGMIKYLKHHFRYWTMNSWNRLSSYANNMKIYNLELTEEERDMAYDLLNVEDFQFEVSELLRYFTYEHDGTWQAGFNGRSGGYLVLYAGEKKETDYKSFCRLCGQRNFKTVEESGKRCGRCGNDSRENYQSSPIEYVSFSKGIDMDEDFEKWSLKELQDRVSVVMSFDRLCDDIVALLKETAKNYIVSTEEVLVPKEIQVLVPKE